MGHIMTLYKIGEDGQNVNILQFQNFPHIKDTCLNKCPTERGSTFSWSLGYFWVVSSLKFLNYRSTCKAICHIVSHCVDGIDRRLFFFTCYHLTA